MKLNQHLSCLPNRGDNENYPNFKMVQVLNSISQQRELIRAPHIFDVIYSNKLKYFFTYTNEVFTFLASSI